MSYGKEGRMPHPTERIIGDKGGITLDEQDIASGLTTDDIEIVPLEEIERGRRTRRRKILHEPEFDTVFLRELEST